MNLHLGQHLECACQLGVGRKFEATAVVIDRVGLPAQLVHLTPAAFERQHIGRVPGSYFSKQLTYVKWNRYTCLK